MLPDLGRVGPPQGVLLSQLLNEGPCLRVDVRRHFNFLLQNFLVECRSIVCTEGWRAGQHVVHENANAPKVGGSSVSAGADHLRRHVFNGAAKGMRETFLINVLFGKPKVRQLDVPIGVQEYIFRFQVPVNDAVIVKMLHSQYQLCTVESHSFQFEGGLLAKVEKHLTAHAVLHAEVHVFFGREGIIQGANEWVVNFDHDVALGVRVLHIVGVDEEVLGKRLHGVHLTRADVIHEINLAKAPFTDFLLQRKVFKADLLLSHNPVSILVILDDCLLLEMGLGCFAGGLGTFLIKNVIELEFKVVIVPVNHCCAVQSAGI
mmetsp:Transcript_46607/g.117370  ORF Transcript_46607/g.117370 Transcript_46607/m.117370 type:complete len:318 (-) Transcript_46607:415-1368(-)